MEGEDPNKADAMSVSDDGSVEALATGRERRRTAGKNMGALLDAEADDDLALLFAEDEDDEEFISGEEGEGVGEAEGEATEEVDDMQLDSSSDEEDKTPTGPEAEYEGENELQKQEKEERLAKKRKEREGLIPGMRKKVKIDPRLPTRTSTIPPPRPRKKSERISWLPTLDDGPVRSSSRRQTMQNKELTHARLKDSEEKRLRLIATMEEAAKRKEMRKPKQMTQADRLAEAEVTEHLNSNSLNRWEETEKKRSEERRLRLEALHNRRLEGPVLTWWSGLAKWVNDKLVQAGVATYTQSAESHAGRKKKAKEGNDKGKSEQPHGNGPNKADQPDQLQKPNQSAPSAEVSKENSKPNGVEIATTNGQRPAESASKDDVKETPQKTPSFLDGIHLYASMQEDANHTVELPNTPCPPTSHSASTQTPAAQPEKSPQPAANHNVSDEMKTPRDQPAQQPLQPEEKIQPVANHNAGGEPPVPQTQLRQPSLPSQPEQPTQSTPNTQPVQDAQAQNDKDEHKDGQANEQPVAPTQQLPTPPVAGTPPPPAKVERSSRNCIILENFESDTPQDKGDISIFFNPKKPPKLQSTYPLLISLICPLVSFKRTKMLKLCQKRTRNFAPLPPA